jgi:hypothetical protein
MIVDTEEYWFSIMHISEWTIFPWISTEIYDDEGYPVHGWRFTWLCFDIGIIDGVEV